MPIVDVTKYLCRKNTRQFITMVNPVKPKGGEIFVAIAKMLKDRKFLAVGGWRSPSKDKIDIHQPNIWYLRYVKDMRKVYRRTRLLLVPSIWKEPSPRVAFEAMINGIPVIASDIGGIPDTIGKVAILVKKYRSADEWVHKIESLDDKQKYLEISKKSKKFMVDDYNFAKQVAAFNKLLPKIKCSFKKMKRRPLLKYPNNLGVIQ